MFEETYRVRQFNEIKIQQDLQIVNALQKSLNESNEQTNKMTNLLDNFENRLTAMHDLIMPVYEATNMLQIKYSNIHKTASQLDSIIEYYDSVKNLSVAIQAGPGKDIKNYISHLNKLRSAIEYFAANKNQSQKLQNEELWKQGKLNVEREFDQLLNLFLNMNNSSNNDIDLEKTTVDQLYNNSKLNLKETEFEQMVSIIEWYKQVEPAYLDKLYEKIIRTHSEFILDKIKNKDKSGSLGNAANSLTSSNLLSMSSSQAKRNSLLPQSNSSANLNSSNYSFNDDKKNTLRSRLTENLFSSSNEKTRRTSKGIGNLNDSYNNSIVVNKVYDQDFDLNDCPKFIQSVKKTLIMFIIENKFISKLFDKDKTIGSKILERIYDPVLNFLNQEAETLANNTKQITKKCTSKYLIAMFSGLSDLVQMKPHYLHLLDLSSLPTKTTRHINNSTQSFLHIFIVFEKACTQSLKEIIDEIKQDPNTIQPNGNIHPITTETITFIENLLKFDIIGGFIANCVSGENQNQMYPSEVEINLRREASKQNEPRFTKVAYRADSDTEKLSYRMALAEYFTKLFKWLNLNLKVKAEQYDDQNLKWIFLLNNSYKISKMFIDSNNVQLKNQVSGKCKNLNELFVITGKKDLKTYYDNEILTYKREYSKCWSRLLSFIKDLNETSNPFNDLKMKDKDRQQLKDRFSGFNKEFEELYEAQKKYYIPNEQADLAQMLREDNCLYIVGQYKKFYDVYARLNFATNKDKYVKYSPELLGARIREFFTAY